MPAPLEYRVEAPDPASHLFHVQLTIKDAPATVRLDFPRWTPGSYMLREHGRQVENVVATRSGEKVAIRKVTPHQWVVEGGAGELVIRYQVYAHELTVRTSHLDTTHGFFNGVSLFLLPEGAASRRCVLQLVPPAGWHVSTTLPKRGDNYEANDFDHLVDCPVEMGTHRVLKFDVRGIPHEIALWNHGNEDAARLTQDLARLVEQNALVFGGLPYERYLFITHLTDTGRGGLEHRDSTALLYPRFSFRPEKEYESFLTLSAHEHFHLWNVKRIKPKVFAPYDYSKENSTRLLWALEGFTSYYDNLNTRRAGLMSSDRYLTALGELCTSLLATPGRLKHSLEESSLDAWIKYYRQDEHTMNSTVSYYLKGELVGVCLDLLIRHETDGKRGMDDVMRLLWKWTQERGEGLEEDAVEVAAAEVAGRSLKDFFDVAVRSTVELPIANYLAFAGLEYHTRPSEGGDDKGGTPGKGESIRPYFGATLKRDGSIQSVIPGGPAAMAGLGPSDQLVAMGGWRVADGGFLSRLEELKPGADVAIHYFRRDELRTTRVILRPPLHQCAFIRRREGASAAEIAIRKGWMGAE